MKIKYFDKAVELLFLALIFIIPVIFDRRIGIVFSGTKSAFLRAAIIIILMIWVVKLLVGGRHLFRRTAADWPILAYILAICAATITSVNFIISFWGFYGRYEGLVTWICFGALFFITINYFRGIVNLKKIFAVVAPTSTVMAIYGIIQRQEMDPYAWGGVQTSERVIATIGQPNFLAAYLIMAFFIMLYFLLEDKKANMVQEIKSTIKKMTVKKEKIASKADWYLDYLPVLYYLLAPLIFIYTIYSQNGLNVPVWYFNFLLMGIVVVLFALNYEKLPKIIFDILIVISLTLNYLCIFYTQSRGGFLGFIVGAVVFALLLPREVMMKNWQKIAAVVLIIILSTFGTIAFQGRSIFARFTSEIKVEGDTSPAVRAPEQKSIEKPAKSSNVELSGAAGSRGETWKSAAGIISDNPLFGIGPEVLKMVFPRYETNLFRFKEAFHVKQDRCHNETFDVPVTKGLVGFFLYLFVLFTVFGYGFKKWRTSVPQKKIMIASLLSAMAAYLIQNQFSFGVIAITSLFWMLWAIVMNIESEKCEEDNKEISSGDIPWIPVALAVAAAVVLIYFSFQQFGADLHFKTAKSLADMGNLPQSVPEYEKSVKIFPYEGGTITNYGIALLNLSQRLAGAERQDAEQKAISILDYGMKVDPYNADNFYIASRIYLAKGDLQKATDYADKALKIDPYYAEAHLTLANVAERTGNAAEVKAHYERTYEINPNLGEPKIRIGQRMIDENKLDEAFKLFQEMMASDPKNVDVHNALGAIYLKRGDKTRAKEEFELVLSFDPGNAFAQKMLKWLK